MSKLLIFLTLIPLLPILTTSFSPENPSSRRVLVLLDDLALKSSHSVFFNSLQSRGFDLDFKLADDPKIGLHRYGQYLYDGLILFCPTTERKFLHFFFSLSLLDLFGCRENEGNEVNFRILLAQFRQVEVNSFLSELRLHFLSEQ